MKIGVYTWMGNEYFKGNSMFRSNPREIAHKLKEIAELLVNVCKATYHVTIFIIGGSAELWGAPQEFDEEMDIAKKFAP